jgi:hypothetical protein
MSSPITRPLISHESPSARLAVPLTALESENSKLHSLSELGTTSLSLGAEHHRTLAPFLTASEGPSHAGASWCPQRDPIALASRPSGDPRAGQAET